MTGTTARDTIRLGLCLAALTPVSVEAQHRAEDVQPLDPFEVDYFEASETIELRGDPDAVLRMFTPEGRQRWSGFSPLLLYRPEQGWQGAVYLQATIHEDPNTAVVADYDEERRRIRYITVIPRAEAWEMDISVEAGGHGSRATVTYRVTPLSPEMNGEVRVFFEEHFRPAVQSWAQRIDAALDEERGFTGVIGRSPRRPGGGR